MHTGVLLQSSLSEPVTDKSQKIIQLMSVFRNILPNVRDEVNEKDFHKYMKENLSSPCCSGSESNHRLLTFILKDEAPLESSW